MLRSIPLNRPLLAARIIPTYRNFFHTSQMMRQAPRLRTNEQLDPAQGSPKQGTEPPKQSGIKGLIHRYGYAALAIYLGLSVVDFAITFGLVHSMGEEKVKQLEDTVKKFFGFDSSKSKGEKEYGGRIDMSEDPLNEETAGKPKKPSSWISSTLLAEIGVAFAIHKSLIFLRVPFTMAITPPIVKALQRWGFQIGKARLPTSTGTTLGTKATTNQRWFSGWFF